MSRITPAQRARRAALADAAAGHGANPHQPPAPYRSGECRIGLHGTCTEAERVQPPSGSGIRYETCTCDCHGSQRGAAR